MADVIDIRSEAADLFMQAAARIVGAEPERLAGPEKLLPLLLAANPGDAVYRRTHELGIRIGEQIREYLRDIGEGDLAGDLATVGFVAAAAIGLTEELALDERDDLSDDDLVIE